MIQRKLALILEYQGTSYQGFQVQPRAPTIQGELEGALEGWLGQHIKTQGAGRTDAGAHAKGQVVAFTTSASYQEETFVQALNARLPKDIRVMVACEVDPSFDARRHATSREYSYWILNRPRSSALWRDFAHHVAQPLDTVAMNSAAGVLLGAYPHPPFREPVQDRGRHHRQRMFRAEVLRREDLVGIVLEANYFLPHQVRQIAGALVHVGKGSRTAEDFRELVIGKGKEEIGAALPACGLYLMKVYYPTSPLRRVETAKREQRPWLP